MVIAARLNKTLIWSRCCSRRMTTPVGVKADYSKNELIIRKNSMRVEVQTSKMHFFEQVIQLVHCEDQLRTTESECARSVELHTSESTLKDRTA